MMNEAVDRGEGHGGIADHVEMPQRSTGESLRSGSPTRIILCMASVFRSAIDCQGAGRG